MNDEDEAEGATILKLVNPSHADIATAMETAAAEIREGACGTLTSACMVALDEEGEVHVWGWGSDTDPVRGVGILTMGAAWLASMRVRRQ